MRTAEEREALLEFKALHLKEQAQEREHMDESRRIASEDKDKHGNPLAAFLFTGKFALL